MLLEASKTSSTERSESDSEGCPSRSAFTSSSLQPGGRTVTVMAASAMRPSAAVAVARMRFSPSWSITRPSKRPSTRVVAKGGD